MPVFSYQVAPFLPFTKIVSADVNQDFADIKTFLNTTKLDTANIQQYGVARDRLSKGTANYAVFNDGTGALTEAAALPLASGGLGSSLSLTGNQGKAIVVNPGETAFILGSPSQAQLTQSFASDISSLTAGEAITANDAVCLDLGLDGSSNPIYRVFKSDSTLPNRKFNHLGFAVSAATVTAGVYTWVASANFVTSNSVAFTINGRAYAVAFSTSNVVTLQAVATAMATDPDINGAVSDGVHTITITGKGSLFINITGSLVTGGVSQPTIVVTPTVTASGQNVQIRNFGDLDGFTLTTGLNYYLSSGGSITTSPTDSNPVFVGQALSTTILFVNRNIGSYQFTTPSIFARSHGSSTDAAAQATQSVEHYNFIAWLAGTSSSYGARRFSNIAGDQAFQGYHLQLNGQDSASNWGPSIIFQQYNKSTWALLTNQPVYRTLAANYAFNGQFYVVNGVDVGGSPTDPADKWSGSSWSSLTSTGLNRGQPGSFVQGAFLHILGSGVSYHGTMNTSDVTGSATATPTGNYCAGSSIVGSNGYYAEDSSTASYKWTGAAWGANVAVSYRISDGGGSTIAASGYSTGVGLAVINGGVASSAALTTTAHYNDASWAAGTASATARCGAGGSVF